MRSFMLSQCRECDVCVDDFLLTASMAVLKLVIDVTDSSSVDGASRVNSVDTTSRVSSVDTASHVQRESTVPLLTVPTIAVPLLQVDDSLTTSDDDPLPPADDIDIITDSGCCFEDDIDDSDFAADMSDCGGDPLYKTDIQKGTCFPTRMMQCISAVFAVESFLSVRLSVTLGY